MLEFLSKDVGSGLSSRSPMARRGTKAKSPALHRDTTQRAWDMVSLLSVPHAAARTPQARSDVASGGAGGTSSSSHRAGASATKEVPTAWEALFDIENARESAFALACMLSWSGPSSALKRSKQEAWAEVFHHISHRICPPATYIHTIDAVSADVMVPIVVFLPSKQRESIFRGRADGVPAYSPVIDWCKCTLSGDGDMARWHQGKQGEQDGYVPPSGDWVPCLMKLTALGNEFLQGHSEQHVNSGPSVPAHDQVTVTLMCNSATGPVKRSSISPILSRQ